MTYEEAADKLRVDFPSLTKQELVNFVRDFVELHLENMQEYTDYNDAFADLIELGILPEDRYALIYDKDTEKYLDLWSLDYVVEYIEEVKELEDALQERLQPQSRLGRVWASLKAAFRRCRA